MLSQKLVHLSTKKTTVSVRSKLNVNQYIYMHVSSRKAVKKYIYLIPIKDVLDTCNLIFEKQ